jgi:predicted amidohydrolase
MWSTGFAEDRLLPLCATTPGILHELRTLASSLRIVVVGSLPERVGRGVCNTMYVVNATGIITGEYRKAHLFTPSGENRWFRRGTSAGVIPTDAGPVGPLICYDLRFPELSRKYFLEGASVLCVSAQWPAVRASHWDILTVARAVENQAYVAAANSVGPSGPFRYSGGSVIVSPLGERLAALGEEEGVAIGTIDPAVAEETRRRIPCRDDRNLRAYRKTRQPG